LENASRRIALDIRPLFISAALRLLTTLFLALLVVFANHEGATVGGLIAIVLLASLPASDLAVSVLNWDVTHTFKPRVLPKMDAEAEVPRMRADDRRTDNVSQSEGRGRTGREARSLLSRQSGSSVLLRVTHGLQ
jgi:hypothetical protein